MPWSRRYRVVVDTNVFVSGVLFGGNPEKILKLILGKTFDLLISPEVAFEIIRKLELFGAEAKDIDDLKYIFNEGAIKVVPKEKVNVCRDPKDNMFLELSLSGNADYLVTGDKDLLEIKEFKGTKIIKPKEFLEMW